MDETSGSALTLPVASRRRVGQSGASSHIGASIQIREGGDVDGEWSPEGKETKNGERGRKRMP